MTKSSPFDVKETGTVLDIRKIIVRLSGLPTCANGQPLTFPGGGRGMIMGFDKKVAMALLFEESKGLKAGDMVLARNETLTVPVGKGLIGRVVNGVGVACDGKEALQPDAWLPVFAEAPGITDRSLLTRPLYTGTKILDSVIPIAKGQRELIVGDRVTGKTTLAVDAILNQKGKNVVCIYCCIGRSYNFLLKLTRLFREKNAFDYSVVVGSTADSPVGEQYLAPYTAASIGEYFMRQGRDVLVVFDDLTKHAWIYRQISLLTERPPGREAYPGDIFYIHSQLIERAAQLKPELGGGSMTFLPIVETQQGDLTGYISTNLISMTDGQVYLSPELFQDGFKPAIDLGLSVSRIGNKIQCPAMRSLCGTLRLQYVQYKELLNVTKMRSMVSKQAQEKLKKGLATVEILKQNKNEPVDVVDQIFQFYALKNGVLDDLPPQLVQDFKNRFYEWMTLHHRGFVERMRQQLEITETSKEELNKAITEYLNAKEVAQPA